MNFLRPALANFFLMPCEIEVVPTTGLEPVRCYSLEPESSASANSATWAITPDMLPEVSGRGQACNSQAGEAEVFGGRIMIGAQKGDASAAGQGKEWSGINF